MQPQLNINQSRKIIRACMLLAVLSVLVRVWTALVRALAC